MRPSQPLQISYNQDVKPILEAQERERPGSSWCMQISGSLCVWAWHSGGFVTTSDGREWMFDSTRWVWVQACEWNPLISVQRRASHWRERARIEELMRRIQVMNSRRVWWV